MSSNHNVVVWEYQCGEWWFPHSPEVTRTLERAYAKRLTRVVLADADPNLGGYFVNLRTLKQTSETSDGATSVCGVRRREYCGPGAPGSGGLWMWAGPDRHFQPMPMEMQCALERGGGGVVAGWRVGAGRAVRGGEVREVRRVYCAPYPRAPPANRPPPPPPRHQHNTARSNHIPQQHTGSSVHSMQSIKSIHSNQSLRSNQSAYSYQSNHSNQSTHSTNTARSTQSLKDTKYQTYQRSASPKEKKTNLAKQILQNLNPFSSHSSECERWSEPEEGSEARGRRHSLDTVSTYLSHETNQHLSVGSLLNVSAGSDDVFDLKESPEHLGVPLRLNDDTIARSAAEEMDERRACVVCAGKGGGAQVAIPACGHRLHVSCLHNHLHTLTEQDVSLVRCPVCQPASLAPPPARPRQPPGTMERRAEWTDTPPLNPATELCVFIFNFQGGRQRAGDPLPGRQYYAVGFPREVRVPLTAAGRLLADLLIDAWEQQKLFHIGMSKTTGSDHVVTWSVPPPLPPTSYPSLAALTAALLHCAHQLQTLLHHVTVV